MACELQPAAALNTGSRPAGGRILFYLDSDIIARPDLLSRHMRYYEQRNGPHRRPGPHAGPSRLQDYDVHEDERAYA